MYEKEKNINRHIGKFSGKEIKILETIDIVGAMYKRKHHLNF